MDCKHQDGLHRNCAQSVHSNDGHRSAHHHHDEYAGDAGAALNPADIVRLLRSHVRMWIIPTAVCTVLAAGYALLASRDWRATQALIVRPEAASVPDERLGKFSDLSEMKTLQETILELAKSHGVIESTLKRIGPPNGRSQASSWPSPLDIEDFRRQVDMRPPGGAEFGKTEVFYLAVLDTDRVRASLSLGALCEELEHRLQSLRDERAQSMIAELRKAVALSEADLADCTSQLAAFETKIGADLVELRNLNATTGGQGEVSLELQTIGTERRANEALRRENVRLVALLEAAQNDPQQLLATPSTLLRSQPAVERLKNALLDAQIHTANLRGSRSERHPQVIAAHTAEDSIRGQLHDEIGAAIQGINVDLALNSDREQALLDKWMEARERISHLAESRAEYANLVSASENHTKLVEAARKSLAEARGRQAASHSASVISRIDGVEAGLRPVGPGRSTITAAGGVGGLVFGFGLVFLFGSFGRGRNESVGNAPDAAFAPAANRSSTYQRAETNNPAPASYALVGVPIAPSAAKPVVAGAAKASAQSEKFGLFNGMSLEEAIRSVEGNFVPRSRG